MELHGSGGTGWYQSRAARVATVVVLCVAVVGIAEATTGAVNKVVSIFVGFGEAPPEKLGDVVVEDGGTIGIQMGLSGPGGFEAPIGSIEVDPSTVTDGKLTVEVDFAGPEE